MLLLWLLVAVQAPVVSPRHDLASYLALAAAYGSADYSPALQEIRQWPPREIAAAVADLQRQGRRLRSVPTAPGDIAFGTVEAAVLMHADAGLLSLAALNEVDADAQFRASVTLQNWSHVAAAEARNWAQARERAFQGQPEPGLEILRHDGLRRSGLRERIDRRDFYVAVAAASLAIGFPRTAHPFAENARRAAPLDAEVQFVYGCVAASHAEELALRHRDSDAERSREAAGQALLDALAIDPGLHEARLRLGKLLLDQQRAIEAEWLLAAVDERSADNRQRYLARLFLGRVAERRGRGDEAARSYRRALEAWPDSQAARLALAHALEGSVGPGAPRVLVAASLSDSRRPERATDPWWLYPFGPPGVARVAVSRVWEAVLGR